VKYQIVPWDELLFPLDADSFRCLKCLKIISRL